MMLHVELFKLLIPYNTRLEKIVAEKFPEEIKNQNPQPPLRVFELVEVVQRGFGSLTLHLTV